MDCILTTGMETKQAQNNRMIAYWRTLDPDEPNRTDKSIISRWTEMRTKHTLFFLFYVK